MATYSRLNAAERQHWHERSTAAQQRYGISHQDWIVLCDAEHVLGQWAEREANNEIQRDEPSNRWPLGRPRRYALNEYGEPCGKGWYVADRAAAAMRSARQVLVNCPNRDLRIYWQDDCRGCMLYIYNAADVLERGGCIDSCYSTTATACYY